MNNYGEHGVGDIVYRSGRTWLVTEVTRNPDGSVSYHSEPYPEVAK